MKRAIYSAAIAVLVAGCGSGSGKDNPFVRDSGTTTTTTPTTPTPGTTDGVTDDGLPPGTTNPTPDAGIVRREAQAESADDANYGNGFANGYTYYGSSDPVQPDSFSVEGLAFDGDQPGGTRYARSTVRPTLSSAGSSSVYAVYESPVTVPDPLTGTPITQLRHRAIYGVSSTGETEFAIVRTGSYIGYGFGGFIYERKNNVILPTSGQATYGGDYAGLRDFQNAGGLEYVTGRIGPNVMTANGEATGDAFTTRFGEAHLEGSYFLVMSGNHTAGAGGEVVGIIVVEGEDPRADNVIERETGGFILHRQ